MARMDQQREKTSFFLRGTPPAPRPTKERIGLPPTFSLRISVVLSKYCCSSTREKYSYLSLSRSPVFAEIAAFSNFFKSSQSQGCCKCPGDYLLEWVSLGGGTQRLCCSPLFTRDLGDVSKEIGTKSKQWARCLPTATKP